jgi:hypothetical protein
MKYKIYFPAGRKELDTFSDNVDINIITEDELVYFATLFTINNIVSIMERGDENWFWATDMILIKDLRDETIKKAISGIVAMNNLGSMVSEIGDIDTIFKDVTFYSSLKDWSAEAPEFIENCE